MIKECMYCDSTCLEYLPNMIIRCCLCFAEFFDDNNPPPIEEYAPVKESEAKEEQ